MFLYQIRCGLVKMQERLLEVVEHMESSDEETQVKTEGQERMLNAERDDVFD